MEEEMAEEQTTLIIKIILGVLIIVMVVIFLYASGIVPNTLSQAAERLFRCIFILRGEC